MPGAFPAEIAAASRLPENAAARASKASVVFAT
jgi:hypothetical protein